MKVKSKKLISSGIKDIYWNIECKDIRLSVGVYRKHKKTKKEAEKLVKYLVKQLENYKGA